jgi:tRNA threonylcarbamoyladenosine biosynthesis protein TsaB
MSTILAIETSTELASVALLHGDRMFSLACGQVQTHSRSVLPLVQQVLAQAGVALGDCDALAFGAGPGSFTGVRTACGIVQGLAFGAGLPVVAVSTLQAMALACCEATGAEDIVAVLDARMGEVYWARYRFGPAGQTLVEPRLGQAVDVTLDGPAGVGGSARDRERLASHACGNGLAVYGEAFADRPDFPLGDDRRHPEIMPHAIQVARLGAAAFARGNRFAARDARPVYLRNQVALTTAQRLEKAAA